MNGLRKLGSGTTFLLGIIIGGIVGYIIAKPEGVISTYREWRRALGR